MHFEASLYPFDDTNLCGWLREWSIRSWSVGEPGNGTPNTFGFFFWLRLGDEEGTCDSRLLKVFFFETVSFCTLGHTSYLVCVEWLLCILDLRFGSSLSCLLGSFLKTQNMDLYLVSAFLLLRSVVMMRQRILGVSDNVLISIVHP